MKPEKKPFVVEFKNRRRPSRKEPSIWEKVDLKTAASQVATREATDEEDATAPGQA